MATWDELKIILARLEDADPGPLNSWPGPQDDTGRQPPFQIELAPWAVDVAADLHARFGADVELRVGALQYPQRTLAGSPGGWPDAPLPEADPAEIEIALDGPLRIRSGHAALHGLLVGNHGTRELQVQTSGELIATVVDPASGQPVGGYSGAVTAMLKTFTVAPGATERIPLLVGTASFVPDLGYAVPPGEWGVQANLVPAAGAAVRTPVLPLTITS
jgi:hypothetical protein